jgi:hypothetical protein
MWQTHISTVLLPHATAAAISGGPAAGFTNGKATRLLKWHARLAALGAERRLAAAGCHATDDHHVEAGDAAAVNSTTTLKLLPPRSPHPTFIRVVVRTGLLALARSASVVRRLP